MIIPASSVARRARTAIHRRRTDEARLDATLSLIAPSAHVDHSGSSLWNHLLGTHEILKAWGADTDVCLAGLIHSVYATQYFRTAVVSPAQRRQISSAVGDGVERLAHIFCVVDRQTIREAAVPPLASTTVRLREHRGSRAVRVSRDTLRALRLIDLANELEQEQRNPAPPIARLSKLCAEFRSISFVPSHLTADALLVDYRAEGRLLRHYGEAVRAPRDRARRLLALCVADVPQCAEPRLLLAAMELAGGDTASAYRNARVALDDLRGWAAAWDTRAPLLAWELLGIQLIEAARDGSVKPPPIAKQIVQRLCRARGSR
jgi:hypothetical protein